MMSDIRNILEGVSDGSVSIDEALLKLKMKPFEDIGYAKVDMHRKLRQGAAEVIYGAGKTPEQIIGIADAMLKNGQKTILITRMSAEAAGIVSAAHPLQYHKDAHCGVIGEIPVPNGIGIPYSAESKRLTPSLELYERKYPADTAYSGKNMSTRILPKLPVKRRFRLQMFSLIFARIDDFLQNNIPPPGL